MSSYCDQHGIPYKSFYGWLRKRQTKVVQAGRGDYENLLPQTISFKSNNKY
ncbi:hypothetical protein [Bacteroides thetaiotaomicron]|uniref:hypothetical protein n=1 Tax=Bacteroides thetaiotaomicron TaxID=818 RepID=UPI003A865884